MAALDKLALDAAPPQAPLAKDDICPKCGGDLDTGWECNTCGYDACPPQYRKPTDRQQLAAELRNFAADLDGKMQRVREITSPHLSAAAHSGWISKSDVQYLFNLLNECRAKLRARADQIEREG